MFAIYFILVLVHHAHAQGTRAWAPLNYIRLERELGIRFQEQYSWLHEFSDKPVMKELSKVHDYLFRSDAEPMLTGNHSECISSLVDFSFDIGRKKPYTFQVIDATGKLESGLLRGNNKWYGRYSECLDSHGDNFDGKWCALEFGSQKAPIGGGNMGMNIGVCIPKTCSSEYIEEKLQPLANKSHMVIAVDCPVQPTKWNAVDILSFTILIVLVTLVLIGTAYDHVLQYNRDKKKEMLSVSGDGIAEQYPHTGQSSSAWSEAALSFSVYKNTAMVLDTASKPESIDVLHGMRFLSIAWVMLGHTYGMTALYIDNSLDLFDWFMEAISFQTVGNAYYAVDTFFFLSGLLVTYLGLREITRSNGRINVALMYLHRYIRLTPTYAFLILFVVGFYSKLGDGPIWPQSVSAQKEICDKYWWTNLLYINNVHPSGFMDECYVLGWYLANDMQFYILAPISLYLLFRWPKIGISTLLFGIFGSILTTGVLSAHYKEQPAPVGISLLINQLVHPIGPKGNGSLGELPFSNATGSDRFWSDIYAKPWCRIGVYLVGMLTGYILFSQRRQIRMNKIVAILGWLVAFFLGLSLVYGLWGFVRDSNPMSVNVAAFYNAVSRPVWALALAWVVIACTCGYGGPINKFLTWKVFFPLSRLTYGIYLGHVLVINWWFSTREVTTHYSNKDFALNFMAITVMSIGFSYILHILLEAPFRNLAKVVFSRRKESTPAVDAINNPLLGAGEPQQHRE